MSEDVKLRFGDLRMLVRLAKYLRSYKSTVVFALLALVISTVAELLIPVILQRAIDDYILPQYRTLTPEADPTEFLQGLRSEGLDTHTWIHSGPTILVPVQDADQLTRDGSLGDELRESLSRGLSQDIFLAVDLETSETLSPILQRHPELVDALVGAGPIFGIEQQLFDSLDSDLRAELRKEDFSGLGRSGLVLLVVLAASLVFSFGQIYFTTAAGQGVMKDLRIDLFDHVLRQKNGYLQNIPVGTLVSRVSSDVETINELFSSVLTSLIKDLSIMIGVVVTLFLLQPTLGLITLATLPPVLIVTLLFRTKARAAYRRVRHWVSEVNRFLSEHLGGMSLIHAFARERRVLDDFSTKNTELQKANLGEMYVFASFRPLVDLFSTTSIAVVIYFGAREYLSGFVSLGILVAFINLIRKFYEPVMDMSEKFTILQSAMAGSERVFGLLDEDERIDESDSAECDSRGIQGAIRFDQVKFSYKEGEQILKGLSFSVQPGEKVAIVGSTGAGKTTISNLLTRLWDIQGGTIWLDGVPLPKYRLQDLRSAVQPIQQELSLFSDTIRENILLGKSLSDERLWEVLELVQAKDFVAALPDGLDTVLSEKATNLSTGQRQLLAFARILVQDPRVLILDEATANIDTETESLIQRALKTVLEGRTSLIIAHRLSTIRDVDRILVLSGGTLAEAGTHDQLMAARGLYAKLYRLQFEQPA